MLILVECGLSARKFGRNDRSPAVPPGFRRDFEGSGGTPVPKREYKRKAAVRGGRGYEGRLMIAGAVAVCAQLSRAS